MESSPPSTGKGPSANLAARRAAGEIHADPVQEQVVLRLQAIHDQLAAMAAAQPAKPGFLARLGLAGAPKPVEGPHGLYIWGPVGRGKSMLMDLFFADAPVARKRRVHFHEFMLEVQARLHRRREELAAKGAPPESDPCLAEDYAEQNCALALFPRARAIVRACTGQMLTSVVLSNLAAQTPRAARAAATRPRATGTLRIVIPNPTLRPLRTAHARPPCIPPRFPREICKVVGPKIKAKKEL